MILTGAVFGRQLGFGLAVDELLAHAAIARSALDRDDRQIDARAASSSSWSRLARSPVSSRISHSTPAGSRPARRARSTVASVCPARRSTPPSLATSGNKWPGRTKSVGLLVGSTDRLDRAGPFRGRDAGLRRAMIDRHRVSWCPAGPCWSRPSGAASSRSADLGQDRHAELAAAVRDHEVDDLGRDLFGGGDEIAFVLAVFGVDDDHYAAVADGLDGFFDGGKGVGHGRTCTIWSLAAMCFIIGVIERGK